METEAQEGEEIGGTEIVRRISTVGTSPKNRALNPIILVCRICGAYFFIVVFLLHRKPQNEMIYTSILG